jgi:hypothetical protein
MVNMLSEVTAGNNKEQMEKVQAQQKAAPKR